MLVRCLNDTGDLDGKLLAAFELRELMTELLADDRWKKMRAFRESLVGPRLCERGGLPAGQRYAAAWARGLWRALGRHPGNRKDRSDDATEFRRFAFRWLRFVGAASPAGLLRSAPAEPRPDPYRPGGFAEITCLDQWRGLSWGA